MLFSFLFFFLGITCLVGFLAARESRKSEEDYFLASQSVSPYTLAFSGNASKFSGFIFSGFMGVAYLDGTAVIWLGLGLLLGDFLVYFLAVYRLQKMNVGGWALSIAELITFWNGENRVWLRRLIGFLTLFFLSFYAAAQLKAGGKALEVALGQPFYVGILLSTVVILFYCWSGGIRASIWTDSAQIIMMTLSLLLILVIAVDREGGIANMLASFIATAPGTDQVALIPQNLSVGGYSGWMLFCVGSIGFGMSILGQPHILIRAMALKSPQDTTRFILTSYTFEVLFTLLFTAVGLSTRVILQDVGLFDAELALFLSAKEMLPPLAVGFVLAGVFSSTLSTADSQILSCSASLLRDLPEPPKQSLFLAKSGTVSMALLATVIALFGEQDILSLIAFAYSGLGASIGSVLVLRLLNDSISEWGAILVSLAGGTTVVVWHVLDFSAYINESLPGFIAAFLVYCILKLVFSRRAPSQSNPQGPEGGSCSSVAAGRGRIPAGGFLTVRWPGRVG